MRALPLMREAWASLRARPAATLVAHGGLALALAAALLVALLALAMSQTAPEIVEPERVVQLDFKGNPPGHPSDWFQASPMFFGPALQARAVALSQIARVQTTELTLRLAGGQHQVFTTLLADPALPALLGLRALHGELGRALSEPDAVAITPDLVRQLWGELPPAQALGRVLSSHGLNLRVAAILAPLDARHPLHGRELLAALEGQANPRDADFRDAPFLVNGRVFARLAPGARVEQVGEWMRAAFLAHPKLGDLPKAWTTGREAAYFRALPLPELRVASQGLRWVAVGALGAAGALLVLLAAVNALNLCAAQLLQRQRETALRRALGASPADLLRLWACEQGLALLAAAALAIWLAWGLAPGLLAWLNLPPDTELFGADAWPALAALLGLLLLLLPLILGLPAGLALRPAAARALQGRNASEGPWGRRLRQGLLGLQLAGAMLLLALTAALGLQYRHLLQADRGFDLDGRMLLEIQASPEESAKLAPLLQGLTRHATVKHWSFSDTVPPWGQVGMHEHYRRARSAQGGLQLHVNEVSPGFFATYGMQLLAGDPLQPAQGEARVVLDTEAARRLGFARPQDALGELLLGGGSFVEPGQDARRVVAVVASAHLETGREVSPPRAYLLTDTAASYLTLYGPAPERLRETVQRLWADQRLPYAYTLAPVQAQRERAYRQEAQLAGLLAAVALLAVAVAATGAYALMADTLQRRRTELVLRRLHGANGVALLRRMASELLPPFALALLLALPAAAWLALRYRADFSLQVPLGLGLALPLLLAPLLAALVLTLAAWRHGRQALRLQPIEALR